MNETLICYDICCPRRLGRIYRALCRQALPIQYSVFLHHGTRHQLQSCLRELVELMDPAQDDIRAYPLPRRGLRWSLGKPVLPPDVLYSDLLAGPAPNRASPLAPPPPTGIEWIVV